MILNGNSCVCPQGQDFINGACRVRCQAYSDWVNNRCVCRQGYFEQYPGQCVIINCNIGQRWDADQQRCVPICPPGRIYTSGNSCSCPQGTYEINGQCTQCGINEQYIGGRCDCINGYNRINGQCIQCGPLEQYYNGRCDCINGYNRINGQCVQCGVN